MIMYLLKMIACSAGFFALYHFFFAKEKMLLFSRFYLLFSLIASFITPLITITIAAPADHFPWDKYSSSPPMRTVLSHSSPADNSLFLLIVLPAVLISVFFLMRFVKNLWQLCRTIRSNENILWQNAQLVLLNNCAVPYSFLNYIFIPRAGLGKHSSDAAILQHELAHVQQKHSLDILFVELLQVFVWFNPVLYLYKKAIRINHEFLADAAASRHLGSSLSYQKLLVQSIYVNDHKPLASSFYFFTTKKRILMLQKKFNPKKAIRIGLIALPLAALLVLLFSQKAFTQQKQPVNKKTVVQKLLPPGMADYRYEGVSTPKGEKSSVEFIFSDGKSVKEFIFNDTDRKRIEQKYGIVLPPPPPPAPPTLATGLSKAEMTTFLKLIDETSGTKNGRRYFKTGKVDQVQRAVQLYKKMNEKQKKNVKGLMPPPPPPLPPAPPPPPAK